MVVAAGDLFESSAAETDGVKVKPQVDVAHDRHYRPHVDQHLREAVLNKLNLVREKNHKTVTLPLLFLDLETLRPLI